MPGITFMDMDGNNKKVSIEIELDMDELRKTFRDESLLCGDIVRMVCEEIKLENNEGAEIIKVVRATQLLEKKIKMENPKGSEIMLVARTTKLLKKKIERKN